ncbi:MAG TPA: hypothetical protein VI756_07115 [Blastocatellia bacterium]
MRYLYIVLFASVAIGASSASVVAGGFWIKVGTAQVANANGGAETVLTVDTSGCFEPQNAVVSAQAVGLVAGKQQSIELRLNRVAPGSYQIVRQWPPSGIWVVAVTAEYRGIASSALVKLGTGGSIPIKLAESSDGTAQNSVQVIPRKLTADDLNSALSQLSGKPLHAAIIRWSPLTLGGWSPLTLAGLAVAAVVLSVVAVTSRTARTAATKKPSQGGGQER